MVSGIVPSRAVSVRVKVGGVDTRGRRRPWRPAAARRGGRRRSSSSRPAAGGDRRCRLGRSGSGLSGPTSDREGSRSARTAGHRLRGAGGDRARTSAGLERALGRVARRRRAAGAACVEGVGQRHRLEGPAGPDRLRGAAATVGAGRPGVEPDARDARATLGCSSRSRASSASTRLTTSPGELVGGQALHHDRVRGQREDRAGGAVLDVGALRHRDDEGLGERVADDAVGERLELLVVDDQPVGAGEGQHREPVGAERGGGERTAPSGDDAERVGEDRTPASCWGATSSSSSAAAERVEVERDVGLGEHRAAGGRRRAAPSTSSASPAAPTTQQRLDGLRVGPTAWRARPAPP